MKFKKKNSQKDLVKNSEIKTIKTEWKKKYQIKIKKLN
jgi:hypothetical protein